MKRIMFLISAVALAVSLAACSISSSGDVQKPSDVSIGGTGAPTNSSDASSGTEETQRPEELEATIDEIVLVDESGVKITAKSLNKDALFGPEVKMLIENDSGKDLTFQCRNASVNGYMAETMMSVDVVNGKKANDALTFMGSSLEACGISTIADMEFSFHIFTTDDWKTYLDTPQIQIKTSASDTYEYTFDDSGDLAYDGDGIRVVVRGLAEDSSIFGPSIIVYIENNSGQDITVQTRDVSINGFMVTPIFSSDVIIGKRAVDGITFMSSELEENEIVKIENVELSFHIFDSDNWNTIVDTDTVTIIF